jgi:hypothetical protein
MAIDYLTNSENFKNHRENMYGIKRTIKQFGTLDMLFFDGKDEHTQYEQLLLYVQIRAAALLGVDLFVSSDKQNLLLNREYNWITELANGKNTDLPTLKSSNAGEDVSEKNEFYKRIMPVYRALREDYKGRSIFQWIFNHKQYVAVRDSYYAIEKLIKDITGDSKKTITAEYRAHKSQIAAYSNEEIQAIEEQEEIARARLENEEEIDNEIQAEPSKKDDTKELEEQNRIEEENRKREIEEQKRCNEEEKRKQIEKAELEKMIALTDEANRLNTKDATPEERCEALEKNSVYRKEIENFLKETLSQLNGDDERTINQLITAISSGIHQSDNAVEMCHAIFDAISMVYSDRVNDADDIKAVQVMTDMVVAKIVFPGNESMQKLYSGHALLNKKDLNEYFKVDTSVIQRAKNEYRSDANELYAVDPNNPMERQALGLYKEDIKLDIDDVNLSVSDKIDDDQSIDFNDSTITI